MADMIPTPNAAQVSQTFVANLKAENLQQLITTTLKDETRIVKFNASMLAAVANNQELLKCDVGTLVSANLSAISLGLAIGPLNYVYFVPYLIKSKWKAQLQISYKGYIQLALRSGEYKNINAIVVREGEYLGRNEFTGEPAFRFIADEELAQESPVVGYMATLTLNKGFQKTIYWTKKAMIKHATTYSESYRNTRGNDNWTKDFDFMALKTVLRQLLGKWGVMSDNMQEAYEKDMAVINEKQVVEYIDNPFDSLDEENIIAPKITENIKSETVKKTPPIPNAPKVNEHTGEITNENKGFNAPPIPPTVSKNIVSPPLPVAPTIKVAPPIPPVPQGLVSDELPPFMKETVKEAKAPTVPPPSVPKPTTVAPPPIPPVKTPPVGGTNTVVNKAPIVPPPVPTVKAPPAPPIPPVPPISKAPTINKVAPPIPGDGKITSEEAQDIARIHAQVAARINKK